MKKIIVVFLLMLIPFAVNAECNHDKHDEYAKYANNITSDSDFNKSKRTYNVNIYNVVDGLYVMYDDKKYTPNSNNEVIISNVSEGTNMVIRVYGEDGCDTSLRTLFVNLLYYNSFYKSGACAGYEDKITVCSSEFTTSLVTEDILVSAKQNYDNIILQESEKKDDNNSENTLYTKIRAFALNWGIKIVLALVTCIAATSFYSNKFRKIKHGI